MQLDKTGIAIRERGLLEQMDLALKVARRHIGPLVVAWLAGMLPFALLNHWLLRKVLAIGIADDDYLGAYLYDMVVLIAWETPLATSFITLYLSRALFLERPTLRGLLWQFFARLNQLFWLQIFLRGLVAFWVVYASLTDGDEGWQAFLGMLLMLSWSIPYVFYPFANEILLLEGNPMRRRAGGASTLSRTFNMHGYAMGDMIGRWMVVACVGSILFGSLWLALVGLRQTLALDASGTAAEFSLLLPISAWMVIGYLAIVRFLGYLEFRIRIEGWEVELAMRAEGARLTRQIA